MATPEPETQAAPPKKEIPGKKAAKTVIELGRIAFKEPIKRGVKKAGSWLATKLGLAAIPEPVVSKILAVGSFILDIAKAGLSLLKRVFRKLSDKPGASIAAGAAILSIPILIPVGAVASAALIGGGLALIGTGLISTIGSWFGGAAGAIGGFLGGAANVISGFFSSLATLPTPSVLPLIGVGAGIGVGGLTFLHVMNTSSAFLVEPTRYVGAPVPYLSCTLTPDTPGSSALKELFINAGQWAGVPPALIAAITQIEGGHLFSYDDAAVIKYSGPGAKDPKNCEPNGCGARGPMQFLNDGMATDCGKYTGQTMPDVWARYQNAVNLALPTQTRSPEICNIKDSIYAAAWKIKTDSGLTDGDVCVWEKALVEKIASAYFGGDCTTRFDRLGGKTYCEFVWDYYQAHNSPQKALATEWFFWQGDPRWNNFRINGCTLSEAGCGPTSMATVLKHFGEDTNPAKMAREFITKGFLSCKGSDWEAMVKIPQDHGLISINLGKSWEKATEKLNSGFLIIAITNQFSGHFLVIRELKENLVITNDPAYNNGDGKTYRKQDLIWNNFWAVGR